ncbi:GNAT family N-acetyltransferase [Bythopirellula goksoeyrii]|uniref:N-acetyltransferase domain-containing protein n=1 Tax=Bythopirellula goksoeyrii TaxID=1400387 RepID=A0A5B9QJX8_9BACT|nr:GNAT family N-acetyltransferase [Bythopirellula goksoeyrii]QEG37835.1 hypothetical protein Pr1d_51830 [Bythopirellula goksoeyrii]
MTKHNITVSCPVPESFRVQQVAGMFDVPLEDKCTERFSVELPTQDEPWDVGLIVGPSGSGKSTVARECYGDAIAGAADWPADKAVVDSFGDMPMRQVVELFTAVGFSSPPSWVKPYHVLSTGQRFRCDLARALGRSFESRVTSFEQDEPSSLATRNSKLAPLLVFDEFTSVVDRTVAKACSTAIAKGIRRGSIPCRFVAVTCHYDVAEWLEADWVLDMATVRLERRRLRRPLIELEIYRCQVAAWQLFARHHYLSGKIAPGARCYLALWNGEPVSFCATLPIIAQKNHRRFTRIVTLPDFQGMGIGMRVVAAVAQLHRQAGLRINVTSSHPALIRHCKHSPQWRTVSVRKAGSRTRQSTRFKDYRSATGRAVVSFEFIGNP